MFQGYFNKVSEVFQEHFNGVSRLFQGFFMEVSWVFQECFRWASRKFHIFFEVILGSFKKIFKMFQRSYKLHGTHCSYLSKGLLLGESWSCHIWLKFTRSITPKEIYRWISQFAFTQHALETPKFKRF